jgi:hypothetical protein
MKPRSIINLLLNAAGTKLSVTYAAGGNTVKIEHAGNKVYRNGTLSMILTEEGYITLTGTTPAYHYYLKDHQGNNRVVMDQGGERYCRRCCFWSNSWSNR